MPSTGYERLLSAHRRGSKPAQTTVVPSFVGSSALAHAAVGTWPPTDPERPDEVVPEFEAPASAEPATLEDESEP